MSRVPNWQGLTPEERCVLDNASDEGDLRGLVQLWNPRAAAPREDDIRRLGGAVLGLVDRGILEVHPVTDDLPPLSRAEVARVVAYPPAWHWDRTILDDPAVDEDGAPPTVVWTVLTELGRAVLGTATREELYAFRESRSSGAEPDRRS